MKSLTVSHSEILVFSNDGHNLLHLNIAVEKSFLSVVDGQSDCISNDLRVFYGCIRMIQAFILVGMPV